MATDTDIVSSELTNRPAAGRRNGVEGSRNCGRIVSGRKPVMADLTDTSVRASQVRVTTVEELATTDGLQTIAVGALATTATAAAITDVLN